MEKKIIYFRDIGDKSPFDINKENVVIINEMRGYSFRLLETFYPRSYNIKFVNVDRLSDSDHIISLSEKIKNNEKIDYLYDLNKKISLVSKKDVEEFVLNNELKEFTEIRNSETIEAYKILEKIMEHYKNKVGVKSLNQKPNRINKGNFIGVYSSMENILEDIINHKRLK